MSKKKLKFPKKVVGIPIPTAIRRGSRAMFSRKFNRGLLVGAMIPVAIGMLRRQIQPGSMIRNLFQRPRLSAQILRSRGEGVLAAYGNAASNTVNRAVDSLYNYMHEHDRPRGKPANKGRRRKQRDTERRVSH